ncbi:MAG: Alanyl-tRNA editing protein AlaX-M [Candidatus Heimdallarchaeota archaeon AB_125]|nr:MAG: Alanyl-tRNA editing protein AlaX-M [Candidatus Heimdallarchaeota archaeon AB_125]
MVNESSIPLFWKNPYQKEITCTISKIKENNIQFSQELLYPGGGGQLPDNGVLIYNNEEYPIDATYKDSEGIWCKVLSTETSQFDIDKEVILRLNWERRYSFMKAHSAQHLFTHVLEKLFHCETLKANFEDNWIEMEVSQKLTPDQVFEAVEYANDIINSGTEVISVIISQEEYKKEYKHRIRGKTSEEEVVRLIQLGENDGFDLVGCGGIHVKNLSESKGIVVESLKGNMIKLVVDKHGFDFANSQRRTMMKLEELTQKKDEKLVEMISNKMTNFDILESGNVKLLKMIFSNIHSWQKRINDYSCVFLELPEIDRQAIQSAAKEIAEGVFLSIIGKNDILYLLSSDEKLPANDIVKELLEITGNKGGGNKAFAQISIQGTEKPLKIVENIIKEF